jgi:hypothetical protein
MRRVPSSLYFWFVLGPDDAAPLRSLTATGVPLLG